MNQNVTWDWYRLMNNLNKVELKASLSQKRAYLVFRTRWWFNHKFIVMLFNLLYSPVASQIMAKYGWKDGQGNTFLFPPCNGRYLNAPLFISCQSADLNCLLIFVSLTNLIPRERQGEDPGNKLSVGLLPSALRVVDDWHFRTCCRDFSLTEIEWNVC